VVVRVGRRRIRRGIRKRRMQRRLKGIEIECWEDGAGDEGECLVL
jgi:hypothetical protein